MNMRSFPAAASAQLRRLMLMLLMLMLGLSAVFIIDVEAQAEGATTPEPTPAAGSCEAKNGTSCEKCLEDVKCLWCITTKSCLTYPVRTILPPHKLCPLNDARWGLCWMNFQALIITMAVVGGVIIVSLIICMFCCCKCERCRSKSFENKMHKQAGVTKTKQEERRADMKNRHDEMRKKYGLSGPNPYSRFA